MIINLSSTRNHLFELFIDGEIFTKNILATEKKGIKSYQYIIDKTNSINVCIIECANSRLFRFLYNFCITIVSLLAGIFSGIAPDPTHFFSIKYTKAKIELKIDSESLDDEILIHQKLKNPPFEIELLSSSSFKYEVLFNGRFNGKAKNQILRCKD